MQALQQAAFLVARNTQAFYREGLYYNVENKM